MNITDSQDRWNQPTTAVTPKETGFPTALVIQIVLAIITYLITKAVSKSDREYLTGLKAQLDGRDGR